MAAPADVDSYPLTKVPLFSTGFHNNGKMQQLHLQLGCSSLDSLASLRLASERTLLGLTERAIALARCAAQDIHERRLPPLVILLLRLDLLHLLNRTGELADCCVCRLCWILVHRPDFVLQMLDAGLREVHQFLLFDAAIREGAAGSLAQLHRAGLRPPAPSLALAEYRLGKSDLPSREVLSWFEHPSRARHGRFIPDPDSIESCDEMRAYLSNADDSDIQALMSAMESDALEAAIIGYGCTRFQALQDVVCSRKYGYLSAHLRLHAIVEVILGQAVPSKQRQLRRNLQRFGATSRIKNLAEPRVSVAPSSG